MRERLGCLSTSGLLIAVVVLLGVLGWTATKGEAIFSPGALSSVSAKQELGGVMSHAELGDDCSACHTSPWGADRMADKCLSCHDDIRIEVKTGHGVHGELAGAKVAPTCGGCHTEHHGAGGALTVINERDFRHDLTGYSLRSHRRAIRAGDLGCADCHPKRYMNFDQAVCVECHKKLDSGFMGRHVTDFGDDCLACHRGDSRDGADFDHNTLPFKLTGRHKGLECTECHTKTGSPQALKDTPQTCYACHTKNDEHKGAFGTKCEQCHSTDTWDDANFDHKVFPVNHGSEEKKATCKTCHPKGTTTYDCYGCHEHTTTNIVREHEGKQLAELKDCVRCHKGGREGD